jgi:heat-inducible transcriptional repressor
MGVVGVIGPLRMDYARVVPVVDFMSNIISELLRKRF